MNNLHRSLAPISDAAWEQIEDEARRTFRANAAARRVVDMPDPAGVAFSAAKIRSPSFSRSSSSMTTTALPAAISAIARSTESSLVISTTLAVATSGPC